MRGPSPESADRKEGVAWGSARDAGAEGPAGGGFEGMAL